jgi:hypothetical protein
MIEDSTEEFYTTSSGEGGSDLPKAWHGGYTYSLRGHTMARGCFGHLGHDNGSTTGACIAVEHRPPPRAMTCFLGGELGVSQRSASQHRA